MVKALHKSHSKELPCRPTLSPQQTNTHTHCSSHSADTSPREKAAIINFALHLRGELMPPNNLRYPLESRGLWGSVSGGQGVSVWGALGVSIWGALCGGTEWSGQSGTWRTAGPGPGPPRRCPTAASSESPSGRLPTPPPAPADLGRDIAGHHGNKATTVTPPVTAVTKPPRLHRRSPR